VPDAATMHSGTYDGALQLLAGGAPLVPALLALTQAPHAPGLYAIFVDSAASLPPPFGALLAGRDTTVIYLGKAGDSLQKRLCKEELRHRRKATFFRSLGAVLGYHPPPGSLIGQKNQRNYSFSPADTAAIIAWIDAHLAVRWVALPKAETEAYERLLIPQLRPLLNIKDNPARLPELLALRVECRRIAVGGLRGPVDTHDLTGEVALRASCANVELGQGSVNAGGLPDEVQVEGAEDEPGVGG
jgi:hypothetical protein